MSAIDRGIVRHDYSLPGLTVQIAQMLTEGVEPSAIYQQLSVVSPTQWGAGVNHDHTRQLRNVLRETAGWSGETDGSPLTGADWGPC